MTSQQKMVIEQLRLEVVCPAKAKVLEGEEGMSLMSSNYRFVGRGQRNLHEWDTLFRQAGLSLSKELRKLVKKELGKEFDVKAGYFSGYLGVTSEHYYQVVRSTSKKKRKPKK